MPYLGSCLFIRQFTSEHAGPTTHPADRIRDGCSRIIPVVHRAALDSPPPFPPFPAPSSPCPPPGARPLRDVRYHFGTYTYITMGYMHGTQQIVAVRNALEAYLQDLLVVV
jgi:hypothetical protein